MGNKALAKRERIERMMRFPNPLYMQLKKVADAEHRSFNAQVMVAIEEHLRGRNGA